MKKTGINEQISDNNKRYTANKEKLALMRSVVLKHIETLEEKIVYYKQLKEEDNSMFEKFGAIMR